MPTSSLPSTGVGSALDSVILHLLVSARWHVETSALVAVEPLGRLCIEGDNLLMYSLRLIFFS